DWYLELAKTTLQDAGADAAVLRGTRRTLVRVLETALRLLHPFMPFITEALWQSVAPLAGRSGATVMTAPYPAPDAARIDAVAEADMAWLQAVVMAVRNIRGEMNIPPGKRPPILLNRGSTQDRQRLESARAAIEALVRAESIFWLPPSLTAPPSAIQLVGELEILVPMADLIDVAAERARLERELEKIDHELGRIATKLDNADFVARAPEAVVTRERDRRTELLAAREKLQAQHAQVSALGAAG
ncbi:MAG: class I tRNA ligase family protein, partial [Pseudomonadales bacterium]|nr:class I tRNA ligase family protein [Pseudomonadales bacterium]